MAEEGRDCTDVSSVGTGVGVGNVLSEAPTVVVECSGRNYGIDSHIPTDVVDDTACLS